MFQDLRYGVRMLLKNPGFTAVAVLTLALGIGANTAIFSVINGVLLKPLPYDQSGQLVQVWEALQPGKPNGAVSPGAFTDWKEGSTSLEALSLINEAEMNLAGEGQPESVRGLAVSASYLHILRLQSLYPKWKENWGVMVVPLHEQITGKVKPTLLVLMGAVGIVLLIACANVANLLLAKAASRQKEMAIRAALGASRWRVIQQVLTESSLLALVGGLLGVGLAYLGVQVLSQWSGPTLPRVGEVALDSRVLGFSLLASVATGLLFGLVPALQVSTPNLNHMLKEGGRGSTTGLQDRVRSGLIVAEVALALTLLVGAGLLVRSFFGLLNVDPGFNPRNTLAMDVSVPPAKYFSDDDRARFFQQICERLEALPGVEAAGMASSLPMLGWSSSTWVKVPGRPNHPEPGYSARYDSAAGNYFSTMGIPLLRGRDFSARDNSRSAPPVIVVNEALVKKIFPNEDPLGKRLRFWNYSF